MIPPTLRWSRVTWLLTGVVWAASSLVLFAGPQYWDPVTILDWTAVWTYTAAWLLLAPTILLLRRLSSARTARVFAIVCAVGAIVAGSANALEDGLGIEGFGTWYVIGFLAAGMSLIPLALAQWRASETRLAALTFVLFFGIMLFTEGGGLIILGALGAIAIRPGRFIGTDPQMTTEAQEVI